jgi:hypothetical protein
MDGAGAGAGAGAGVEPKMDGAGVGSGAGVEPKMGFTFCCGVLVMFTFGLMVSDGV